MSARSSRSGTYRPEWRLAWVAWQVTEPVDSGRTNQWVGQASNPRHGLLKTSMAEIAFTRNVEKAFAEDVVLLSRVHAGSMARHTTAGQLVSPVQRSIILLHQYVAAQLLGR